MKKRTVICLAGLLFLTMSAAGCGRDKDKPKDAVADIRAIAEDAEYGEVSAIDGNIITIKKGTLKDEEDMSSMLDLTGEETDLEVSESTVIKRMNMRGMRNGSKPEGTPPADMEKGEHSSDKPEGTPPADMEEEGRAYDEINEEISINDINEGDVISVIYNDDGSAAEISIMSMTRREK